MPTGSVVAVEGTGAVRDGVVLLWIPVGAGGHVVRHTSAWWETVCASLEHRRPVMLFHAALELYVDDVRYVVEMAPAWVPSPVDRGVVTTGPVGARWLGRSRYFRYEVRRWACGVIPDREFAGASPIVVTVDRTAVVRVLRAVSEAAPFTWGRRVAGTIGSFTFGYNGKTYYLPAGWLEHDIRGKGLNIARESAQYKYGSPGGFQVCNVRYAFQNRASSNGSAYSTIFSPPYDGCYYTQVPTYTFNNVGNVRTGLQCARFYIQGTYRGESCHSMSP